MMIMGEGMMTGSVCYTSPSLQTGSSTSTMMGLLNDMGVLAMRGPRKAALIMAVSTFAAAVRSTSAQPMSLRYSMAPPALRW
jgi:hypothetical protein